MGLIFRRTIGTCPIGKWNWFYQSHTGVKVGDKWDGGCEGVPDFQLSGSGWVSSPKGCLWHSGMDFCSLPQNTHNRFVSGRQGEFWKDSYMSLEVFLNVVRGGVGSFHSAFLFSLTWSSPPCFPFPTSSLFSLWHFPEQQFCVLNLPCASLKTKTDTIC